ncbi:MAG: hypothetical protein OHK0023_20500 [Anaerolineae bacterium]
MAATDKISQAVDLVFDKQMDQRFRLLVERDIAPVVTIGKDSHGSTSCPGNANHALAVGAVEEIYGRENQSRIS